MRGSKSARSVRIATVPAEREGQRLDNFLAAHLDGLPRSALYRLIRKGQVRINGGRAKPSTRLREGDKVRIPPAHVFNRTPGQAPESAVDQLRGRIVAQEEGFLLIDKPSGMAVHGGSGLDWGLIDALRQTFPEDSLELVHRLDRQTSGCLLVASNAQALKILRSQFAAHEVVKRYLCLGTSRLREDKVIVDEPLARVERGGQRIVEVSEKGKPAQTEFRLLEHYGRFSFFEAIPRTGRTHQIRAHAAWLGVALAGDDRYGPKKVNKTLQDLGLNRLFLHAHSLEFEFPEGTRRQYHVALPEALNELLNRLPGF